MSRYVSTRDSSISAEFRSVVFRGLAPDGGLYMPTETPMLSNALESCGSDISFVELSERVLPLIFPDDIDERTAADVARTAFPFAPQIHQLHERLSVLELFHGPSCAFKDFGASFLAHMMEHYLGKGGEKAVILTATSGDTGSAVARAFHGRDNLEVVILYPSGRVSHLQEQQLTTLGGNVCALEVQGSFDDCQAMVKEVFQNEQARERYSLTSANSINLGRLLPQALYYLYAAVRLRPIAPELVFSVPSGNFGNVCAGVLAWRWGMPARRFVAATNANDVVPEYLASGVYRPRPSVQTLSNAMDVGNPSNFERLASIFASLEMPMTEMMESEVADDEQTLSEIRRVHSSYDYFVCPHTATGTFAAEQYLSRNPNAHVVTLATAHPAKFVETVERAVGIAPEIPERLAESLQLPKQATLVPPNSTGLLEFLADRYGDSFRRSSV